MRSRAELPFVDEVPVSVSALLLDTTVYIDEMKDQLPHRLGDSLSSVLVWHSPVTEAEMTTLIGMLDPEHTDTPEIVAQITSWIEQRLPKRILTPDREIWSEAGILAGTLARLQGYAKADQRKTLNDALIFLTAAKHGCMVLTRNVTDFDLMMQLVPQGKALFYERLPTTA